MQIEIEMGFEKRGSGYSEGEVDMSREGNSIANRIRASDGRVYDGLHRKY